MCWLLLFAVFAWAGSHHSVSSDPRAFTWAYTLAYPAYLFLAWAAVSSRGCHAGRGVLWLALCIVVRVPLLGVEPSDDAFRYVWEGRVQREGFNPYLVAPDDPALVNLRDANWERINHPDYPAIYPPVAQLEFRVLAGCFPTVAAIKYVHACWDVLALLVIAACLRRLSLPIERIVLYGACPLILSAFAVEGHLDAMMIFFLSTAWLARLYDRRIVCGVALGVSLSVKLFPIVLLPWLASGWFRGRRASTVDTHLDECAPQSSPDSREVSAPRCSSVPSGGGDDSSARNHVARNQPDRRDALVVLPAAILVFAVSYLPFIDAGRSLLESLRRFTATGTFFSAPEHLSGLSYGDARMKPVAVLLLALLLLAGLTVRRSFASNAVWAGTCFLLVSPIFHYWYAAILFMFFPVYPVFGWLVAAGVLGWYFDAFLASRETGQWIMPVWLPYLFWWLLVAATLLRVAYARTRGGSIGRRAT